jgi:cytoskeletal protein RodZ
MVFVKRQLDEVPKTLGEKLRALRRGQAVSLDMVEAKTHIQRGYLVALEQGDYPSLPDPMYTRNFIRAYATLLNADADYFLELYADECGKCDLVDPMRMPRQRMRLARLLVWNRFIKYGFLGVVALLLVIYFGFQFHAITAPPELIIVSPVQSQLSVEASVTVEGVVDGEATVYVNGEQVIVHEDQSFTVVLALERGMNIILIEAERRYSRRASIERRIVFEPEG